LPTPVPRRSLLVAHAPPPPAPSTLSLHDALPISRKGYGAGVRAVFDQGRAAALAGVVGTVADLLEVPAGMERAIEAVLGERLQRSEERRVGKESSARSSADSEITKGKFVCMTSTK